MKKLYFVEDGIVYLNVAASDALINWARSMCELKGYDLVFILD